jgi:BirA family biotin operon repressor/biotin-[acetyl-CoA-carboxylase] ligase
VNTKDQLLVHLKEAQGEWVSGEVLSRRLNRTRAAIWKHVCRLREDGYIIDSSPKKGYFLRSMADSLLPGEILSSLRTRCLGRRIESRPEAVSTNRIAKELALSGEPEGTLIIAETQTGGRGRKGRTWFSPPGGGIYLSLILRPSIHPAEATKMSLLTGVALADALVSVVPAGVSIKWPNDILARGKKIAGILVEVSTEIDAIDYMVIGVGLNVNIPREGFPAELRGRATSVLSETGIPARRVEILCDFLSRLEDGYLCIGRTGFLPVIRRWKELTDTIGRHVRVPRQDGPLEGIVAGIDDDGILLLKGPSGSIRPILSGEVEYIEGRGKCSTQVS